MLEAIRMNGLVLCFGEKLWIRPATFKIYIICKHMCAFQIYELLDSFKMNFQIILDIKNSSSYLKKCALWYYVCRWMKGVLRSGSGSRSHAQSVGRILQRVHWWYTAKTSTAWLKGVWGWREMRQTGATTIQGLTLWCFLWGWFLGPEKPKGAVASCRRGRRLGCTSATGTSGTPSVVILEEGKFPHPRCPMCDMLVMWKDLNGSYRCAV